MSKTNIEWCKRPGTIPKVWNPVTGCNKVSQGCKNCYAERMHKRLQVMHPSKYGQNFNAGAVCHEGLLTLPITWKKPCTVFVNSMSDLFHKNVPFSFIYDVFKTMEQAHWHTFIILTKRAERLLEFFMYAEMKEPLPNVWLGVSVEDQAAANERIPFLLKCPAAVRVLSVEPMLGPVDIIEWLPHQHEFYPHQKECITCGVQTNYIHHHLADAAIHQVFCGGESGPDARPMHPDWARHLQLQCAAAGVAFFFKQWGEYNALGKKVGKKASGRLLDGVLHNEFSETFIETFVEEQVNKITVAIEDRFVKESKALAQLGKKDTKFTGIVNILKDSYE